MENYSIILLIEIVCPKNKLDIFFVRFFQQSLSCIRKAIVIVISSRY